MKDNFDSHGGPMLLTPNLNGTSRARLIEERIDVVNSIYALQTAMSNAWPNARDYQLQPDNFTPDCREWNELAVALRSFATKLENEAREIQDQEDACRAN
jgi:hypothetical protein